MSSTRSAQIALDGSHTHIRGGEPGVRERGRGWGQDLSCPHLLAWRDDKDKESGGLPNSRWFPRREK